MKKVVITCLAFGLLLSSCVDGFKDDYTWSSSVQNMQLESPKAEDIKTEFSADGSMQTISWPVVLGAGGYKISVYNYPQYPDTTNVVLIGEEEAIDALSYKCESFEENTFKVVLTALGNEKMNNTEGAPTTKIYDNLIPLKAHIPPCDLTAYFDTAMPKIDEKNPAQLMRYTLEGGGAYTMSGSIKQGMHSIVLTGTETNHAKLTIANGSFINGGGGFQLRYMDIDYSGFTGTSDDALILMENVDLAKTGVKLSGNNSLVVPTSTPLVLRGCNITGLKTPLYWDYGRRYAIGTFLIRDCIIGYKTAADYGYPVIRLTDASQNGGGGTMKDISMINSTFYNETRTTASGNYLMRAHGADAHEVAPLEETWGNASWTITSCTFWQMGYSAQSFNSNGKQFKSSVDRINISKVVLVDSYGSNYRITTPDGPTAANLAGGDGFCRRFTQYGATATFQRNSYWWKGYLGSVSDPTAISLNPGFKQGELGNGKDQSGTHIETDPMLTFNGAGANPLFTMNGADQIRHRVGDPRWLPVQ